MTTIEEIILLAKPHPNQIPGARQVMVTDGKIILSIVGGAKGLYGDFVDDFELAILDSDSKEFVTKYYFSETGDDVMGYQGRAEVEKIFNLLFKNDFQVI